MGRIVEDEGPPVCCMHPVLVESKRRSNASGSASLRPKMTVLEEQHLWIIPLPRHVCLQNYRCENSPRDTPLPMLTYICCSFPLTLRSLCWSPFIPALSLTSFCRVYCDATCCFASSHLDYKHNHGYLLIRTTWKQ